MRPEDESRDPPPEHGDEQPSAADQPSAPETGEAGEHEAPPPATFAGRRRAEQEPGERERTPGEEAEGIRADSTEELEQIERDRDQELAAIGDETEADDRMDDEDVAGAEQASEQAEEEGGDQAAASEAGATVEADTVALADREEAQEAALAGLRARTAKHEAQLPPRTPPDATGAPAAAGEPEPVAEPEPAAATGKGGRPPRAKPIWARFLAASFLIVASMAAATAISLLVYLTDIAEGLGDNDRLANLRDQLADVGGGDPQTLLILGSDKRLGVKGDPGRSDTTILLRVDPDKDRIALLSIPRDLKVHIPGLGTDRFNAAYTYGGPKLTLRTVQNLLSTTDEEFKVSHVVNINFTGFADAVNAIGCVYIDVDHHYYIPPESGIAEIDVEAGYQRLCGFKALQYVRYRHTDTDLVRSARQQDFLREARQKLPPGTLIRDRNELLDIFTEYTTSDISDAVQLLELLKTFAQVQSAPVLEVHFPADLGDGTSGYVTASKDAIQHAVDQFLATEGTPGERPGGEASNPGGGGGDQNPERKPGGGGGTGGDGSNDDHFVGPEMQDSSAEGQTFAHQMSVKRKKDGDRMITFPVYYPTRLLPGSLLSRDSRAFVIDGPDKDVYHGYKLVAAFRGSGGFDEYYGVSGTDWVDAPILDNPSEVRTIDGKQYELFYDGDRLRLVGWKTKDAAYWVDNTLLQSLDEDQMLSIATSMREYKD